MTRTTRPVNIALSACLLAPSKAAAHVSEQGFVLLLPTGAYTAAGIAIVLATLVFLAAFSGRELSLGMVRFRRKRCRVPMWMPVLTSLLSTGVLFFLLFLGLSGPRDPLSNLLPLTIWTMWWVFLFVIQGFTGNLWAWINPWTGLARLLLPKKPPLRLPRSIGFWPALAPLTAFSLFTLANPAPDDPARLASVAGSYWFYTILGMLLFGPRHWLHRCECFTIILVLFARLSIPSLSGRAIRVPGRELVRPRTHTAIGTLALVLLGVGSFDGLNETFWWLAQIGVNPLAFPGRSAVIWETALGLGGFVGLLIIVFLACVWAGHRLAVQSVGEQATLASVYGPMALTLVPIAFGYHIAHYLTAFLVNCQYTLHALSDPFATGADYLGLGTAYVTTGFFNTQSSVRAIWLSQAAAVVLGHCLSLVLAHKVATRLYGAGRPALLSQTPMSLFMVVYTGLGLWLLATPRGA